MTSVVSHSRYRVFTTDKYLLIVAGVNPNKTSHSENALNSFKLGLCTGMSKTWQNLIKIFFSTIPILLETKATRL